MSKPKDFYWGDLARTLSKLKEWATSNKFSCQHQPLIDIELENVVLDELHLMLRVVGRPKKHLRINNLFPQSSIIFMYIINRKTRSGNKVNQIYCCGHIWYPFDTA